MIEISNPQVFGKIIAKELAAASRSVTGERALNNRINALAKAAARIESWGKWMSFDEETGSVLIWSDSDEIYEISPDGEDCQCTAFYLGKLCWHRTAAMLIRRCMSATAAAGGPVYDLPANNPPEQIAQYAP